MVCEACGERIKFRREVKRDGTIPCHGCAGERYSRRCKKPGGDE